MSKIAGPSLELIWNDVAGDLSTDPTSLGTSRIMLL